MATMGCPALIELLPYNGLTNGIGKHLYCTLPHHTIPYTSLQSAQTGSRDLSKPQSYLPPLLGKARPTDVGTLDWRL